MPGRVCPQCGASYEVEQLYCSRDGASLIAREGGAPLEGEVIGGRYRVVRKLGEGGMGEVYLAEHVQLRRRCALKVMRSALGADPDAASRFLREATNASRIEHPGVAAIYDFGEAADGRLFFAMEFVDGVTLGELLEASGPLPPKRVANILSQVAEGLAAAHEIGLIHRDLKPDNIMIVTDEARSDRVKLVDFGISKVTAADDQRITTSGAVIGTPAYMSPEQAKGQELDARSDVFALGVIVTQLLTGALPFEGETPMEQVTARLTEMPRTLSQLVAQPWGPIEVVVARATAPDLEQRYPTARAFATAFAASVGGIATVEGASDSATVFIEPPRTRKAPPESPPAGRSRGRAWRRRALLWAGVGAVAVTITVAGSQWLKSTVPPPLSSDSAQVALERLRQLASDSSGVAATEMLATGLALLPRLPTAFDSAGVYLRVAQAQGRLGDTTKACRAFENGARAATGTRLATVLSNGAIQLGCR